jgi:hypothetical protein
MEAAAAANAVLLWKPGPPDVIDRKDKFFDRFQDCREFTEPVWNHLKTRLFPLQPALALNIDSLITRKVSCPNDRLFLQRP